MSVIGCNAPRHYVGNMPETPIQHLQRAGQCIACRWFEALEQRSAYRASQSDHYTHCFDIPPQYGTCWPAPGTEHFAMAINGNDNTSWKLPLPPLTSISLEPRSNCEDSEVPVPRHLRLLL